MPTDKRVALLEDRVADTIQMLERLLEPSTIPGRGSVLADLHYRSQFDNAPDGFGASSSAFIEGRGKGGTIDRTGDGAVLRAEDDICPKCNGTTYVLRGERKKPCKACGATGRKWADPIGEAVGVVLKSIDALYETAKKVDRHRLVVLGAADKLRGRQSSLQGICRIDECRREVSGVANDRLRRGLCSSCFLSFSGWRLRHGSTDDPGSDNLRFLVFRNANLRAKRADPSYRPGELQDRGELPKARTS